MQRRRILLFAMVLMAMAPMVAIQPGQAQSQKSEAITSFDSTPMENDQVADAELSPAQKAAITHAQTVSFDLLQARVPGIRSAREEFVPRESFADQLQMAHVRLDQTHQGVKVFQGELITHFQADGSLAGITGDYFAGINVSTTPRLTSNEAITIATEHFGQLPSEPPTAELMILPKNGKYVLTYRTELVDIASETPAATVYFINAKSGKVTWSYDNLETATATGSGRSLYSGVVPLSTNSITGKFELRDMVRGSHYTSDLKGRFLGTGTVFTDTDNTWGSGVNADPSSAGVDAHYGAGKTFDYYKLVHGRNGIANNGQGGYSRVHYGRKYNNAFWSDSCFCMTYGDGDGNTFSPLVSIDVAAHEMTHGVTSKTARLVYSGESGGLNEATSDIFGTCTEFYAANSNDPGDYLIGEEITKTSRGWLRSMSDPRGDGASIDHYTQYTSGMDVHYSSGLANHFFYLLSEGGTNRTSGLSVTGITRAKAEKIWYRALTVYMTSGTTYAAARTATLNAARDLFGGITSTEYNAVAATWTACGVN